MNTEKLRWVIHCWWYEKTFHCAECGAEITYSRAYHDLFCEDCRERFWEKVRGSHNG